MKMTVSQPEVNPTPRCEMSPVPGVSLVERKTSPCFYLPRFKEQGMFLPRTNPSWVHVTTRAPWYTFQGLDFKTNKCNCGYPNHLGSFWEECLRTTGSTVCLTGFPASRSVSSPQPLTLFFGLELWILLFQPPESGIIDAHYHTRQGVLASVLLVGNSIIF